MNDVKSNYTFILKIFCIFACLANFTNIVMLETLLVHTALITFDDVKYVTLYFTVCPNSSTLLKNFN